MLSLSTRDKVDLNGVINCYRVLNISNQTGKVLYTQCFVALHLHINSTLEINVFDTCIFPRETIPWWKKNPLSALFVGNNLEFKQPDRETELTDYLQTHLENEFHLIQDCKLGNAEDCNSVYQKIVHVYTQCNKAVKVDITPPTMEGCYFTQQPQQVYKFITL